MTGLLLINLGTPDEPQAAAVRRYLRQFLSDPRVLDIPALGRWALLNFIILPTRPARSAEAYQKIWDERGSPLLYHSQDLCAAVQARLGPEWAVELGMRYGNPSIEAALTKLRERGADRVVVFPLYPQYSSASTGSSVEEVFRVAAPLWVTPNFSFVEPFYDEPAFLDAFAARGRPFLDDLKPDQVLFSFHGLPERHVRKSDPTGRHCLESSGCCDRIVAANRHCYRAQCFASARGIAARLGLPEDGYRVTFQSRLGRTPWIRPYTEDVIPELARAGAKRLLVLCPAFVADCLETLEEIGQRAEELFKESGGEVLRLVPSLNSEPAWADAVVALVRRQAERYLPTEARPRPGARLPVIDALTG